MGPSFRIFFFFIIIIWFCLYKQKLLLVQYKQLSFKNFMVPAPPTSSTEEMQQTTLKMARNGDFFQSAASGTLAALALIRVGGGPKLQINEIHALSSCSIPPNLPYQGRRVHPS